MEATLSRSTSVCPRGLLSRTAQPNKSTGVSSNASLFSVGLQRSGLRRLTSRRCRGPISARGGNPEQPAWGNITDQDLAILNHRIQGLREKERQLRISVSWFGKDLEASFFEAVREDGNQAQLAGSNLAWVNNPMLMSMLSMTPLYLLYVAFMVGCMNHGSFDFISS